MASSPAVCTSCQTPLPAEAQFCPHCGSRTPTQISGGGTPTVSRSPDQLEDQQVRLQAAFGADYTVERLIGSGGFAAVWAAFDRKLQRRVAVKVLHPDLVATRSLLERFQREAQAVAKLRHPGVIPIYAVGELEGLAYYIMPLVEGESLRERIAREGPLPPDEVRRILREATAALAVAHEAGIVHRDIKPENLMLEGKGRRVVVMDFGIAKSTVGAAQSGLTGTGMIIGTPAYMSPEQATGSKEVNVRSDVYSLGVVGYELLTGKLPFAAQSVPELILQHVSTPAPSVASVRADTPQDLAIAVNRCLQKDPGERWKDAGELSAFLEQASTPAAQPAVVSRDLRKYARRGWRPTARQVGWAAVSSLAVAVVLLFSVSPGDLGSSVGYWARRAGLTKVAQTPGRQVGREIFEKPPVSWALSGSPGLLPMGSWGLAVIDPVNSANGLHVFDGQAWRSYRTPEPLGAAARAGDDILLFGGRDGGRMYRWSRSGVTPEDTIPFGVRAAWADSGTVVVVGRGEWRMAVRDAKGWRRVASARRTHLSDVAGTSANDLIALGGSYFSSSGLFQDSVAEFDGTSWETVAPGPPGGKQPWLYETLTLLGDRSPVIGGEVGDVVRFQRSGGVTGGEWNILEPLLLVRSSRGHWRRMPLKWDATATFQRVAGVWGPNPDTLFAWDPSCDTCRLAEIRKGTWSEGQTMGPGSVRGVARVGGILWALWADGTVWAQRGRRWVYATEVPNTVITSAAFVAGSDWQSGLRVGEGWLWYHVWDRTPESYASRTVLDSTFEGSRGVAVGRRVVWALGADGWLRKLACAGPRCGVVRERFSGGLALVQRRGGGALLAGANGLLVRANALGTWVRVPLPQAMARESVLAAGESGDGRLAALGSQHLAILDSVGKELRLELLPASNRPVSVLFSTKGVLALVGPKRIDIVRADGTPLWSRQDAVGTSVALSDGRLVFGLRGDPADPFARGTLLVVAVDSTGGDGVYLSTHGLRSRITALEDQGNTLDVYTVGGSYEWPLGALPFAKWASVGPASAPRR